MPNLPSNFGRVIKYKGKATIQSKRQQTNQTKGLVAASPDTSLPFSRSLDESINTHTLDPITVANIRISCSETIMFVQVKSSLLVDAFCYWSDEVVK